MVPEVSPRLLTESDIRLPLAERERLVDHLQWLSS